MTQILGLLGMYFATLVFDASVVEVKKNLLLPNQICSGHTVADLEIIMASSFLTKSGNSGDSVSERNRDTSRLSLLQEPAQHHTKPAPELELKKLFMAFGLKFLYVWLHYTYWFFS